MTCPMASEQQGQRLPPETLYEGFHTLLASAVVPQEASRLSLARRDAGS